MMSWWEYFQSSSFGCNLVNNSAESYIYSATLVNSLETIGNFVRHCSNLITDDIGIYLSDLVTKIFKDICLDTKV